MTNAKWQWGPYATEIDNLMLYVVPRPVVVQGKVILQGYAGDNTTAAVTFEFRPVGGGGSFTRAVTLNADGSFRLDNITQDTYTIVVKAYASLAARLDNATVWADPTVLANITLKGGDNNGDNVVSFEDFSILQNNYSQNGPSGGDPLSAAAATASGMARCGPLGIMVLAGLALAISGLGWRNSGFNTLQEEEGKDL